MSELNPSDGVTSLTVKPGDKVDNYEIIEQIGAGGSAIVFKGNDPVLNRTVAIKQIVVPQGEGGDDVRQRAVQEAKSHKQVAASDPNQLVQFIDLINDPRGLFLITEFIDGPSLEWILQSETKPMDQRQALGIIAATSKGLAAIHTAGIVHRDLKPSNILMPRAGGLKIGDFGLAAAMSEQQVMDLGSVRYMSPELLRGENASPASDMYSLGIIAYEMLAGREKFNEAFKSIVRDQRNQAMRWVKWHTNARTKVPPLSQLVPDISTSLSDLVSRMMDKEASRRVAGSEQLLEAIRMHFASAQDGQQAQAPQAHQTGSPSDVDDISETAAVPKRSKVPMILAATLVLWIAVMGGFFYYKGQQKAKAYDEQIAEYQTRLIDADNLYSEDHDYPQSELAFANLYTDLKAAYESSPEKYHAQFIQLSYLARSGEMRAAGRISADEGDYVSARTSYQKYEEYIGTAMDNPPWPNPTSLSTSAADDLHESSQTRAAWQEIAAVITGLLDDVSLREADQQIRQQQDRVDELVEADREELAALQARYTQLRNHARNVQVLADAEELIEQGDIDDAIRKLNETITSDGDAAWDQHVALRDRLVMEERIAESDDRIRRERNRNNIPGELDALQERTSFDPQPEFDRRIVTLQNNQALANAEEALSNDNPNQAEAQLNQILERTPDHPQALQMLASIGTVREFMQVRRQAQQAMASREYEEAIKLANDAIDINGDPDGQLGNIITQSTGNLALDQSEADYDAGDLESAAEQIAIARENLGATQQVLAHEAKIEEMETYQALVTAGDRLFDRGDYGPAIRSYTDAQEVFDNDTISDKIDECNFKMWLVACDRHIQTRDEWDAAESALARAEAIKINDETRARRQQIENRLQ